MCLARGPGCHDVRAYTYNAAATVTAVKGLNALFEQIRTDTQNDLTIRLNLGGYAGDQRDQHYRSGRKQRRAGR